MDAPKAGPDERGQPEPDAQGVRIAGAVVAMAGGLVTALIEVFLTPLRVGTVRLPVSPVLAIVGNVALVWFTYRATGKRAALVLPALVWIAVMLLASGRTNEGDLLITGNNWVGLVTILIGTAAFAIAAYLLLVPRRPAPPRRS
jgi:hypothetical protein